MGHIMGDDDDVDDDEYDGVGVGGEFISCVQMLPITKAFFSGSEVGLCYTGDAVLRTTNATPFNHRTSQQIPNHQNTLPGHEDDMTSKSSKVQLTESSAVYTKYALCALLGTPELKTKSEMIFETTPRFAIHSVYHTPLYRFDSCEF